MDGINPISWNIYIQMHILYIFTLMVFWAAFDVALDDPELSAGKVGKDCEVVIICGDINDWFCWFSKPCINQRNNWKYVNTVYFNIK